MNRRPWILTLVLVALLSPAALAQKVVRSELIAYDTLRNASGGDDLLHEFSQAPERVKVTVQCKLKRGEFAWRVEDSSGKVLWRETVRGKTNVELTKELPGRAGEWRIVLDYREARGKYHLKMEAQPSPTAPAGA